MRIFGYNSPLMTFLSRLGDLMLLNILWLVCCLPIVTAGAATTAFYRCAMDLDEPVHKPILRRFFETFRTGFGKSTVLFVVWAVLIALVLLNCWFYAVMFQNTEGWMGLLSLLPAFVLLLVSSYLFPIHAFFENSVGGILKNAFRLTLAHLPVTVVIAFLGCVPALLLYYVTDIFLYLLAVWTLFGFALIAYLQAHFLKKIFRLYLPETEAEEENGEDTEKN